MNTSSLERRAQCKIDPSWPSGLSISSPMLVICADRSGAITLWNRASAALFWLLSDEALGQSLDLIIPEHPRPRH
jgi:PAS domain-containing protein